MLWLHNIPTGGVHQQRYQHNFILFLIANIPIFTWATTEWFGDSRAYMNPAHSSPFYDIIYDISECPDGLESEAIPEYAYFGPMVASMGVLRRTECLENCEKGFCELLSETQLDNPRLMRPIKQAAYFENIQCRTGDDIVNEDSAEKPLERSKDDAMTVLKKLSEQVDPFNLFHRQRPYTLA
uniref:Apple domain-containing protein n=1 Tax=Setaria digitata TaxID=48799 RepID=A0A915Q4L2_9BILA